MSFANLQEDILREILKLFFYTPTFFILTEDGSRLQYSYENRRLPVETQLLRVCKRWYRIATPLLYGTIDVRSDDETEKLVKTLESYPALRPLVLNLRIEGAYGKDLPTLAKYTPNLHRLAIQCRVLSKTHISGLRRALRIFNPTELYVHGVDIYRRNRKSTKIVGLVMDTLQTWNSLNLLSFPERIRDTKFTISELLSISPRSLRQLAFNSSDLEYLLLEPGVYQALENAGVNRIRCYGKGSDQELAEIMQDRWTNLPDELKECIVYEENPFHGHVRRIVEDMIMHMDESELDASDVDAA